MKKHNARKKKVASRVQANFNRPTGQPSLFSMKVQNPSKEIFLSVFDQATGKQFVIKRPLSDLIAIKRGLAVDGFSQRDVRGNAIDALREPDMNKFFNGVFSGIKGDKTIVLEGIAHEASLMLFALLTSLDEFELLMTRDVNLVCAAIDLKEPSIQFLAFSDVEDDLHEAGEKGLIVFLDTLTKNNNLAQGKYCQAILDMVDIYKKNSKIKVNTENY